MKKLYFYLMAATAVLGTACEKKLNLANPDALESEVVFSTEARLKGVLVGNYAALGAAAFYGSDVIWMSELLASDGELNWVGTFNEPRQIITKGILVNNSNVFATYRDCYRVIFNSNNILANLGVVKASERAKVEGEALALRAISYFELVKLFGEKPYIAGNTTALKGVPLFVGPGPSAPQSEFYRAPRASVEAVYTQVIADLIKAEAQLPPTNGVYFTKQSAALLLSRVYLQQGRFAEARDAADRAIVAATGVNQRLVTAYAGAFNNSTNTTEDLFTIQVNLVAGTNSCFSFFSTGTYGARDGDIEVNPKHMNKYTAGDARAALFFFENGFHRVGKWRDNNRNVKVLRLAEAYLVRAECNSRLGTSVGATVADDLHRTRARAGLARIDNPTLANILAERELELAFEGQGIWDAKRLRQSVDGLAWDNNRLTFPIPLRERNINPGLEQNPGYN
ncbi:MAG: RagB/SusD family nutrient uptake outer membrane protein [Bacteroidetes bacterium]|nr:MAG: RagB/SusD family nutrient uptake outer membrane protein [Bacteroidota bacterium]